jgi:hypothetical protein
VTPLTPAQIDDIRARHRNALDYGPHHSALDDVGALLVEIDRLNAREDSA